MKNILIFLYILLFVCAPSLCSKRTEEICDDGFDNDYDSMTDFCDPDCWDEYEYDEENCPPNDGEDY